MAKRRKTRTHKADTAKKVNDGTPKSFVLHAGEVGSSVKLLSKDLRRVLEPNTASRLRERKSNKIKDFLAMAGPVGVTHIVVLGQSSANQSAAEDDRDEASSNVNLRISRLPRGPTLGFKVLRYALVKDILAATKRPHAPGTEFTTEPILILNNLSATNNTSDARQLNLMQSMFQNLFPPIRVHSMPLSSARRVVLLSYNPVTRTIDFRHFLINVRPVGISRSVRKLIDGTGRRWNAVREGSVYSAAASDATNASSATFAALRAKGLPDLRNAQDISDYILRHGDMGFLSSASEAESDASGAESGAEGSDKNGDAEGVGSSRQFDLEAPYVGRANRNLKAFNAGGQKRAVKLTELGPRMELGLVKIEDGIGDGKGEVLFHEFIHKTAKEAANINRRAKEKEKLAAMRRKEQEANVKRKREEKENRKAEKKKRREQKLEQGESMDDGDESEEEEEEEGSADEFEYEDMFAEDQDRVDGHRQTNLDAGGGEEDDELLEEAESEGEDEDDDSDLSPIPYHTDEEGENVEDADSVQPVFKKPRTRIVNSSGRGNGQGRSANNSAAKTGKPHSKTSAISGRK